MRTKNYQRSYQSKNPRKAHSSFWSREFSDVKDLFVMGRDIKTPKASTKTMKLREMKSLINFRGRWELAPAFTATAQLSPGPKFSEDNNDATNDAGIQKHL